MRSILSAPCGGRPPIRIWGTVACALGGPGSAASTVAYQLNRAGVAVAAENSTRFRTAPDSEQEVTAVGQKLRPAVRSLPGSVPLRDSRREISIAQCDKILGASAARR